MREDGTRIFDNAYNLGKTYITWLRFTASYHELSKYTKESNGVLCPRSLSKCLLSLVILSGLATKSSKILYKIAKLKDSSNENQFRAWCARVHAAVFMHVNDQLTLHVRGPSYLGLTRSISRLLMPWLLTSPGHQKQWYWLCRICRPWSYLRNDFKYLCHINVE